jgi:hypothetical protein
VPTRRPRLPGRGVAASHSRCFGALAPARLQRAFEPPYHLPQRP